MIFLSCPDVSHTHKSESPSTNSELIGNILDNTVSSTSPHLMTADTQSLGRGQHSRAWLSPVGNVYLSLYVPMTDKVMTTNTTSLHHLTGALSLLVGYSLWQLPIIQHLNQIRQNLSLPIIKLKWANDLGVYQNAYSFEKLAGILIEPVFKDAPLGVVIGVGLNVAFAPKLQDHQGGYQACCLHTLLDDTKPAADELYLPIASALFNAIALHNRYSHPNGTIALDDSFINAFNHAHALHGKLCGIYPRDTTATPSDVGVCTGINPNGTLQLKTDNQDKSIFSGTVKWLQ